MHIHQNFLQDLESFSFKEISPSFLKDLYLVNLDEKRSLNHSFDYPQLAILFEDLKIDINKRLEKLYVNLPVIHPLKAPFTLFSPMGYDRWELAYTKTLGFLLNHQEPHNIGPSFIEAFMKRVLKDSKEEIETNKIVIERVFTEKVLNGKRMESLGRADIIAELKFVTGQRGLLFIEAKVDAHEGPTQLERYEKYISTIDHDFDFVFKIFLSPKNATDRKEWINLTLMDLLECIEEILPKIDNQMENAYLAFFGASILKDVIGITNISNTDQYSKYKIYKYLKSTEN